MRLDSLEDRAVPGAGALDTTFSGDGKATQGLLTHVLAQESGNAMAVQADGKIVVAGTLTASETVSYLAVYRYNPDGSLDPTFDGDGKVLLDAGSDERAFAVAIQADGKIVVAGDVFVPGASRSFLAVRLNANGSPDTSFDGDGIVVTSVIGSGGTAQSCGAQGVAIQGDGKIVLAGSTGRPSALDAFAVVRYMPNGAIDNSFDTDGRVFFDFGTGGPGFPFAVATAVAIDGSGRIVVGGVASSPAFGGNDFAVARLNAVDGSFDNSFSADGKATIDIAGFGDDRASALALDGTAILLAGTTDTFGLGGHFALARLLSDGTPDAGFDMDGRLVLTIDPASQNEEALALALDATAPPNRKLVVAGLTSTLSTQDFAVARLNAATGVLDTSFSGDGKQTIDFGNEQDTAHGVAVTGTKVLLAGTSSNNAGDFALARLDNSGSLDPSFGVGGRLTTNFGLIDLPRQDFGNAVLAQADGKVVVAGQSDGDIGLVRFNRDGTLDTTFGDGGSLILDINGVDQVFALAAYPGGKILAVGEAGGEFALLRFDANGNPDSTFDGDGRVTTSFPTGNARARAVAVMPDGRIVAAGDDGARVLVARYLPNGRLDTSLDFDGKLVDSGFLDVPNTVAVGANGSILVTAQGGIARYLSDGRLDPSFGGDGRWDRPPALMGVTLSASAVQGDGKVVVTGYVLSNTPPTPDFDFVVFRLMSDGTLDSGFGNLGVVVTDFAAIDDFPAAVRIQADGKVIVAGTSGPGNFSLARYTTTGTLDAAFGTGGKVFDTFGSGTVINALYLQANGKLDIAGRSGPTDADFAVAQFRGDNTNPTSTGIPDVTVDEDAPPTTIDLNAVYDDAQDTDAQLTYSVQSNTVSNGAVTTAIVNGVLTLTYPANKYGTGAITVRATDLDGGFTDTTFNVTINSVNDPPVANDDVAATNDQTAITVNVLANDTDNDLGNPPPDTDVLTIISATGAQRGTVQIVNNQVKYTPRINTAGAETITYTIRDKAGATDTATLTINVTDITPPVVQQIRMQYGNRRFETLQNRFQIFGWSNVTKFEVKFSENVDVQSNDLVLTGVNNPGGYSFAGFNYNATTFTATWTLSAPLPMDRLTLKLDGTTAAGIKDLTSGNLIGQDVARSFGILPGDLNGNGLVDATEPDVVKSNIGKRYPSPRTADVNGDGVVTRADYLIALANKGKKLP
ncbi:MAG TPA: Ig-like domain-containing protein [Gemmataceae bacterium]|nr:Ig-like domain-containing protein [Gemmataceae bacterium]